MTRESAVRREEPGDTVTVLALFDDVRGCEKFAQRLLSFGAGSSKTRLAPSDDELFYVLEGRAELHVDGDYAALRPGIGVYLRRGTRWSVECDRSLELVSVLVRSPAPGSAAHAEVDLAAAARSSATASRQFVLGIGPEHGCPSVTQFIGFIPPGRAPDHFHRYDEVIYILAGEGVAHVGEESDALAPGVCLHLPAGHVHSLENAGPGELELLGVFTPAGSPAAAYYPDGAAAATPKEI